MQNNNSVSNFKEIFIKMLDLIILTCEVVVFVMIFTCLRAEIIHVIGNYHTVVSADKLCDVFGPVWNSFKLHSHKIYAVSMCFTQEI